tara:strand:+ start:505 stop:633 length:129 start_codon:yes stop_codon:yes gene_type:complete
MVFGEYIIFHCKKGEFVYMGKENEVKIIPIKKLLKEEMPLLN